MIRTFYTVKVLSYINNSSPAGSAMIFIKLCRNKLLLGVLTALLFNTACSHKDYKAEQLDVALLSQSDTDSLQNKESPTTTSKDCYLNEAEQSYRLGPEDSLNIIVYGENELSGEYKISDVGTIDMPLIGDIKLVGCTLNEAENKISRKYSNGYLVNPSISSEIKSYKPFYITGEVRAPGRFDYMTGMSIIKAVSLAGGFTYRANRTKIQILQNQYNKEPVYKNSKVEEIINPGDVIIIKERLF
jgi:polysaccharide export outer membrane protein